jgi:hypothetical protein
MSDNYPPSSGPDTASAYAGLIVGAVILFVLLFGIVRVTDAHFKSIEAAESTTAPAATQ